MFYRSEVRMLKRLLLVNEKKLSEGGSKDCFFEYEDFLATDNRYQSNNLGFYSKCRSP